MSDQVLMYLARVANAAQDMSERAKGWTTRDQLAFELFKREVASAEVIPAFDGTGEGAVNISQARYYARMAYAVVDEFIETKKGKM